ncbi:zinc-ribbon domain-containing protein [Legionella quinlivanii]|nr:zinc-ribbon domain-containing protein [Legionella quinlivanii]
MSKQTMKKKVFIQDKEFDSLESAAKAFGKSRNTVDYRLSKGWTPEQAVGLDPPPDFASKTAGISVQVEGREFKTLKDAAKYYNRAYTHVIEMVNKGRSIEQSLGLVKRIDTLQSENPKLSQQWHPHKNLPLTPQDVSSGSGRKVWWLCPNNHEWEAVINSRNRGCGCPYCASQKPTRDRNFATEYPELLKEFDLIKNKNLKPENLTPRAKQKVWWECLKGHSWQATITNRTRNQYNNSCPYCTNRKLCDDNSLAQLRSDIAQDWHPTKNQPLTPHDVIAGGGIKVWWTCKHGHDWQATVGTRVNNGAGCSKCALQTSRIEIAVYTEIKALFPNVSWREKIGKYECDIFLPDKKLGIEIDGVYWHKPRSNIDSIKQKLFEETGILLFRLREEGLSLLSARDISFKWSGNTFPIISSLINQVIKFADFSDSEREKLQDYIDNGLLINNKLYREIVSQLPAPPYELSLAAKKPEIAKEWAYDLNAPLSPEHFRPAANKNVWWRCEQGHTWETSLNNRSCQNTGCPHCPRVIPNKATSKWNFAKINPQLVNEWHYEKNGGAIPEEITPNMNIKVWWKCREGHEWQAAPHSRTGGTGCPFCYGRYASETNNLAVFYPELLAEWDSELNKGLNPSDFTPHVGKKVWWRCKENHTWQATIYNRTKNKSRCPICAQRNSRKYSIDYFHEFASRHGGICLTTEYLNGKSKIKMVCKNGHKWESRADNILYKEKWCSSCSKD